MYLFILCISKILSKQKKKVLFVGLWVGDQTILDIQTFKTCGSFPNRVSAV